MTAPVEGAVATFSHTLSPGLKPTSTAQQFTSVQTWRRAVACSPRSSQSASFTIVWTEVWWFLKIDQVHGRGGFVSWILRLQMPRISSMRGTVASLVGIYNSGCAIKPVLKEVSHSAEAGQAHPTGAHGAGAWHAVALALLSHLWWHSLQREERPLVKLLSGNHQYIWSMWEIQQNQTIMAGLSITSLPFCQPHCCVSWWGSADLCLSHWSRQTRGWTSGQSPHCHCSPPSASLALQDLCGGNHMCTTQWPLLSRSEPQHGLPLRW